MDDTEKDDDEIDNGSERRVKILKKVRKKNKGSDCILISKLHALRARPHSPKVEVIGGKYALDEIWESCKVPEIEETPAQKDIKRIEKESRILE